MTKNILSYMNPYMPDDFADPRTYQLIDNVDGPTGMLVCDVSNGGMLAVEGVYIYDEAFHDRYGEGAWIDWSYDTLTYIINNENDEPIGGGRFELYEPMHA